MVLILAIIDTRYYRIPNRIVYPGIAAAVFYHTLTLGLSGAIFSLTGLIGGIGLLLIPFLLRWIGAGDAKLLGFIGAAWGWSTVFEVFILATLSGGVLALGIIIANPTLLKRLIKNARCFFVNFFISLKNRVVLPIGMGNSGAAVVSTRETIEVDTIMRNRTRIPYGVAIAMGVVIWIGLDLSGYPLTLIVS